MCPHCRQTAPLVYRGVTPYCAACGKQRNPLTASNLNMAGKPTQITGFLARGFGWFVLVGALLFNLVVTLPLYIIEWYKLAMIVGIPTTVIALGVSVAFLFGGKKLKHSGQASEERARMQAIMALASHKGGSLTTFEVSQSLSIPYNEADSLLTKLAKEPINGVSMDFGDSGDLIYRFMHLQSTPALPSPGIRVGLSDVSLPAPVPARVENASPPVALQESDSTETMPHYDRPDLRSRE
jgi:hypothetical protein